MTAIPAVRRVQRDGGGRGQLLWLRYSAAVQQPQPQGPHRIHGTFVGMVYATSEGEDTAI